jgi:hypothetical protein
MHLALNKDIPVHRPVQTGSAASTVSPTSAFLTAEFNCINGLAFFFATTSRYIGASDQLWTGLIMFGETFSRA